MEKYLKYAWIKGIIRASIAIRKPMLRLLLVISLLFTASVVQATEVRGLRVWASPDKTRAVLDLSGSVEYRLFQLAGPQRVVVDLDLASVDAALAFEPQSGGMLTGVRHGIRDGKNLRIVMDLKTAVEARSFLLPPAGEYGHRLVVDLFPKRDGRSADAIKTVKDYQQDKNRDVVIAVDAGHGGDDPGAIGAKKTREKNVTLAIAKALKKVIDGEPGMRAVLIREGDYYMAHRDRFEKARKARADLFVSIHADAFRDRRVAGSSVFVLSRRGASSEAAKRLADKENQSDLIGGVTLNDKDDMLASVLLDLSQNATQEASNHVAAHILNALKNVGKTHKRQVESAGFLVLKSPDVPSVLVETAFISNPAEEKRLNDKRHQRKLAEAIASGIRQHFLSMPPPGTWMAAHRQPSKHVVARGETLGGIAQRYQVSVSELRKANKLKGDRILVGASLVIPTG